MTARKWSILIVLLILGGIVLPWVLHPSAAAGKRVRIMLTAFFDVRLIRDEPKARSYLTTRAKDILADKSGIILVGTSNPHFAEYEIREIEQTSAGQWKSIVRITEEFTGSGPVGWFDEHLVVVDQNGEFLVDLLERGPYHQLEQ